MGKGRQKFTLWKGPNRQMEEANRNRVLRVIFIPFSFKKIKVGNTGLY